MALEPEDRTEEKVGGEHKRIQTERPAASDHARIVITLHISSTREYRQRHLPAWQSGDTLQLARKYINEHNANHRSLADLVALADSVEVDAAR